MSERPRPLTAKDFDASDPEPDRVIKRQNPLGAPLGAPPTAWDYHQDKMDRRWNAELAAANLRIAEERATQVDEATKRAIRQAEWDVRLVEQWEADKRAGKFGATRPVEAFNRLVDHEWEHPAYQERARELMPEISDS